MPQYFLYYAIRTMVVIYDSRDVGDILYMMFRACFIKYDRNIERKWNRASRESSNGRGNNEISCGYLMGAP